MCKGNFRMCASLSFLTTVLCWLSMMLVLLPQNTMLDTSKLAFRRFSLSDTRVLSDSVKMTCPTQHSGDTLIWLSETEKTASCRIQFCRSLLMLTKHSLACRFEGALKWYSAAQQRRHAFYTKFFMLSFGRYAFSHSQPNKRGRTVLIKWTTI